MTLRFRRIVPAALILVGCGTGQGPLDASAQRDVAVDAPPPSPRLIAPLSGAKVTSRRPTLRFAPGASSEATRVEVCRDRGCQSVVATLDAAGNSAQPGEALAPGVYFWRARAASDASATWEFVVGPRDASVDTSWGILPDYDGDGYADLIDRVFDDQNTDGVDVYVFPGGAGGISMDTRRRVHFGTREDITLEPLRAAGDVNGDGFVDMAGVLGLSVDTDGRRGFRVYLGGASGIDAARFTQVRIPPDAVDLAAQQSSFFAADVDGDGYGDIGFALADPGAQRPHLEVFRGGPLGLTQPAWMRADLPPDVGPDLWFTDVSDQDGDGRVELLTVTDGTSGRASVMDIANLGTFAREIACELCPSAGLPGGVLLAAGDADGDGRADAIAFDTTMAPTGPSIPATFEILPGSATGLASSGVLRTFAPPSPGADVGALVPAADVDGNGTADVLLVEERGDRTMVLQQWRDLSLGPESVTAVEIGRAPDGYGAYETLIVGDLDGDGTDDFYAPPVERVFYGSPAGYTLARSAHVETNANPVPFP